MSMAVFAFALAWRFIAPDVTQVVAMEWKTVLNSTLSAEVRREIPPNAVPVLARLNFIEGIDRVVWTPELVVLEGSFDVSRLRDMAVSDGGAVRPYRQSELVVPADKAATVIGLRPSIVLLGSLASVQAAFDRADKSKAAGPGGFDLWTRTAGAKFARHEFGLKLGDRIQVSSTVRYASELDAQAAAANASAFQLTASTAKMETAFTAALSPDEFRKRQWRVAIESLRDAPPPKPSGTPAKIRIYGLDEGLKEIPLK